MKLCVDCVWHKANLHINDIDVHYCTYIPLEVSPVTGKSVYPECGDMRKNSCYPPINTKKRCGPDAEFFEAKP